MQLVVPQEIKVVRIDSEFKFFKSARAKEFEFRKLYLRRSIFCLASCDNLILLASVLMETVFPKISVVNPNTQPD